MEITALKSGYAVEFPQAKNEVLPRLPLRALALAPSSGGKTNMLVTLLTNSRFYRGKFSHIYWCSPTATVDPSHDVLREYIRDQGNQGEDDPAFHDSIDVSFLQSRVTRQKKVTEHLKKHKLRQKGFNMLLVLDDLADVKRGLPEISRFVDGLFVKARHWGCLLCYQRRN